MSSELPVGETYFPLHAENITVSNDRSQARWYRSAPLPARTMFVDETLNHKRVQIDRIPVDRQVDAVPPIRQEGDTTILSVVEETVVVERRLILKEEIHIRRLHVLERHQEAVILRKQEAVITRIDPHEFANFRRNRCLTIPS